MSTNYPTELDTGETLKNNRVSGNVIPVSDHNDLANAVIALESKLGAGESLPVDSGDVLTVQPDGSTEYQSVDLPTRESLDIENVDNTSDLDKPISNATRAELDTKIAKGDLVVNVKDVGATGDGVTDDASAISSALSGGNKKVYFPAGNYLVKSYLRVQANTEIELHPKAVILNALTTGESVFLNGIYGNSTYATGYTGDGNIYIHGGTIDCAPLTAQSKLSQAIAFAHAENIIIDNVRFINNYQNHFIETNACKNVRITRCYFAHSTLTAPGTRECINVDYSYAGGFPHFGGYDNTVCDDVIINACTFEDADVSVGSHAAPPSGGAHIGISVINCTIKGMVTSGISPRSWTNSNISNNKITLAGSYGISAFGTRETVFANNIIKGLCALNGIQVTNDSPNLCYDNLISGNLLEGVTSTNSIIFSGTNIKVVHNTIKSTGNVGIIISDGNSSNITIQGNTIVGSSFPIILRGPTGGLIQGNYLQDYTASGMLIGDNSGIVFTYDVTVSGNRLITSAGGTVAIDIRANAVRTFRYGNRYYNAGSLLDAGSGTVTVTSSNNADVVLSKSDIGLSNVDNTSDVNKPVSTAVQTALNLKATDSLTAHLAGAETFTGAKVFSTNVQFNGNVKYDPGVFSTDLTLFDTSRTVLMINTTSGNKIMTLPSASISSGTRFIIKKTDASLNTVTLATVSSQLIDGSTTYVLATQYKYVEVIAVGSAWMVVGNN